MGVPHGTTEGPERLPAAALVASAVKPPAGFARQAKAPQQRIRKTQHTYCTMSHYELAFRPSAPGVPEALLPQSRGTGTGLSAFPYCAHPTTVCRKRQKGLVGVERTISQAAWYRQSVSLAQEVRVHMYIALRTA